MKKINYKSEVEINKIVFLYGYLSYKKRDNRFKKIKKTPFGPYIISGLAKGAVEVTVLQVPLLNIKSPKNKIPKHHLSLLYLYVLSM